MPLKVSQQDNIQFYQGRFIYVLAVVVLFFLTVMGRLYNLQIRQGDEYRAFAVANTLKDIRIPASRGIIFDRNGIPLVSSQPSFDLAAIPQYVKDFKQVAPRLAALMAWDLAELEKAWQRTRGQPPFYPFVLLNDIGYDTMVRIMAQQALEDPEYHLPGVEIIAQPIRRYPQGSLAANIIGYVREATGPELKRLQGIAPGTYFLGDRVGAIGIESRWELLLRGQDGVQQKFVNAVGKEVSLPELTGQLAEIAARPGINLHSSLDYRLQQFAEEQFKDKTGSLVALQPDTGEVLAIVSSPSFDLNQLSGRVDADTWKQLSQDPDKVFYDRAIQAAYPPGSTYKMVIAAAGLEEKVIGPQDKIVCTGGMRFGNRVFHCWNKRGHGAVDVHRAIVQSCDVYFYTVGLRLGVDRIAEYAQRFGFNQRSGIDLNGEAKGLIPTSAWKQEARKDKWHEGETLSISIGQGYDLVTPLQNALMIAAFANGGWHVAPTLVRQLSNVEGKSFVPPLHYFKNQRRSLRLSEETVAVIRSALAGVVSEPGGTAGRLRALNIPIAGKTGTAQVVGYDSKVKNKGDHAWFVAFAPVEHPEIAVSVLVEHGGHGSSAAAPLAGALIQKYMQLYHPKEEAK